MSRDCKSNNNWTFSCKYHLVFCPKYRRKVLTTPIDERLKEIITGVAEETRSEILETEIMPDHVHLFVKATPVASPHWIVQQLKGNTSRLPRLEFTYLRSRLPTLWTRSYYIESVGRISEATIKKYIEDQKGK